VVYACAQNAAGGNLFALDAATGDILWSFESGGASKRFDCEIAETVSGSVRIPTITFRGMPLRSRSGER